MWTLKLIGRTGNIILVRTCASEGEARQIAHTWSAAGAHQCQWHEQSQFVLFAMGGKR